MCPSYLATGEEKHSTRGRAHLLHEMTPGEVIRDGWDSDAVEDALSLCLACKGCKSDCPVGVDVATWKAEFRSHHYARRLRPRSAYSMGHIDRWAKLLPSRRPDQCIAQTSPAKWAAGIHHSPNMPPSPRGHSATGSASARIAMGGDRLLLVARYVQQPLSSETLIAAAQLLERSGFR